MPNKLPPLLPSDEQSLREDRFDTFYKKRPSDIWLGQIERTERKESPKCEHEFKETKDGVECRKCSMGLLGPDLTIKNGQLYVQGKKVF